MVRNCLLNTKLLWSKQQFGWCRAFCWLVSQIKGFTDEGLIRSTGPSFFPTAWLIHQAQDVRKSSEDHQIIYIIVTVQQLVAYLQSMAQDPPGRYSWTDRLVARQKWNRERGELEISRASFGRIQELDAIQRSHLGCHNFSQHFNWGFGHTKSWATGLFFFSKSFGAIAEVSVSAPVTHHLRSNHLSTQLAFWPFGSDGSPAMMFARQKPPDSKLETLQLFDLISTFNLLQVFRSSASMLRLKSWAKIFCALRYFRLCVLMFAVDLRRFGNSNLAITKVLHKRIVFQIILYIACVIFHVYYAHDMQFPCMNKSNVNHYQSHLL